MKRIFHEQQIFEHTQMLIHKFQNLSGYQQVFISRLSVVSSLSPFLLHSADDLSASISSKQEIQNTHNSKRDKNTQYRGDHMVVAQQWLSGLRMHNTWQNKLLLINYYYLNMWIKSNLFCVCLNKTFNL